MMRRLAMLLMAAAAVCATNNCCYGQSRNFEGLKALVVQPEVVWGNWDAAVFGAMQERGFDVTCAQPGELENPAFLRQFDLVASNIRRRFTDPQVAALKNFIAAGGAYYGSWGGPMKTPKLLREACHVAETRLLKLTEMTLLPGTPLSEGIAESEIVFPKQVGHLAQESLETIYVKPLEGGIAVAEDADGNVLGVLGRHGRGRTAVLGFAPEQDKRFANRELAPVMMDNLLRWLMADKLTKAKLGWSGEIEVSLPARAEGIEVFLNDERIAKLQIRSVGSLKKIKVDVRSIGDGAEANLTLRYKPLSKARNVETMIFINGHPFAFWGSPAKLVGWVASVHATEFSAALRWRNHSFYKKAMPEDVLDSTSVLAYKGDFLADVIEECHKRDIKFTSAVYFQSYTPLKKHPDAVVMKKGKARTGQICFNNPKGHEYNLETIRQLFKNYKLDGHVLDDNFEIQRYNCTCSYCKKDFRAYCRRKGLTYQDPAEITGGEMAEHWSEYQLQATRNLAAKVAEIAAEYDRPAGGWVQSGMESVHLGQAFDFLGGMVYTEPPRAVRLMLSSLENCRFITLLWALGETPEHMEKEIREAVHAGSTTVGFWVYPPGFKGVHPGVGMQMLEGSHEAIGRAFSQVEREWFKFYRNNVIAGDVRFAILEGKVGSGEMTLRLKNAGKKAGERIQGKLDLEAIAPDAAPAAIPSPVN